ncbi:MAG: glycosyltransferase [Desulfamplus sp.]|nr:glycosyltransferase [Desulfamplus sp.]
MTVESEKNIADAFKKEEESFIFLDTLGKRWPKLRLIMLVFGLILFISLTLFAQTLFVPSEFKLPLAVQQIKTRLKALQNNQESIKNIVTLPLWLNFDKSNIGGKLNIGQTEKTDSILSGNSDGSNQAVTALVPHKKKYSDFPVDKEIRLGFYENWDPDSLDSLKANADKLTHLCPDWISLVNGRGKFKVVKEKEILDIVQEHGIVLLPLLNNMSHLGNWSPDIVEGLLNGNEVYQNQFIEELIAQLKEMEAGGTIFDFEDVDPFYRDSMTAFLVKVASALHNQEMELWLCVPMGKQLKLFDLDTLAEHVDRFVAMLHDQNGEFDLPGPIASQEWFNGWFNALVDDYAEPFQWVIALGSYGYDWADGKKEADHLSFEDVMSRAFRSSLESCEFDNRTMNPHFLYQDEGVAHTVWFLDAITFFNQLKAGREHHLGGIAISRLGTEDPGIWHVLNLDVTKPLSKNDLELLEIIKPGDSVANISKGNFLSLEDKHSDGKRHITDITAAKEGLDNHSKAEGVESLTARVGVMTERYEKFPSYTTIIHKDSVVKDAVTITFDDGPDSDWTPPLLDILKEKGVKATFFMVGAKMEDHPDIVRRIVREGHTVGVHTYTHPNIALVSEERANLEFNATQRLIEAITGHSTILFRPPYNADTNPRELEELVPIKIAQDMGYITVSEDIDTEDWDRPGVEAMVERVKEGRLMGGNIVLLHDSGGDRSQTVEALPEIIDYLRVRGDTIISLPEMLGVPSEQLMPIVPKNQHSIVRAISGWGFTIIHNVTNFFWAFMIVATSLVVLRTLIVAFLAIRNKRQDIVFQINKLAIHKPAPLASVFSPPVSVLIAAYNEDKVIHETLKALLASSYAGEIEIVLVDDGSKDNTAQIVEVMASSDNRIRLIRQLNYGKATALKNGFNAASHEIVVTLDADTQFEPNTIYELVSPLADPSVGAVSGRAKVGNTKTMVARFQSLEYTCGFNLDRRAYHQLNCITVVPGAVSAFRKSAVTAAGGISTDTLAEDTDLTLSMHKSGFKVHYASKAVAWTEAPETIFAFSKQRFRWAFGTLQCLWKHRDMLFDSNFGALGWFSLPSAWFFNIFLVALGPIIDAILLFSLIISPANLLLYFYFGIFLLSDLLLAGVACRIEDEPLAQIKLVVPMRFIYRPVLSYAVARAIIKAAKGVWVGWGKLDRTASVTYDKIIKTNILILFCTLSLSLFAIGCQDNKPVAVKDEGPVEFVMPDKGAYNGAYVDFGDGESNVTYDALTDFDKMIGKHLAVVAFGNFWGDQEFPLKTVRIVSGYGAVPLIFWSPWDKPYVENRGPDRFNLPDILAGKWDSYIDKWAEAARQYDKPLMIAWGIEMNGSWFPWSGRDYGGGEVIGEKNGKPIYKGPELVKKAYRYVVDRVRAKRADNIIWGFHANNFSAPQESWNEIANYYPGSDYVDWLGLSVYGKMGRYDDWALFHEAMDRGYEDICKLDSVKPVIVAEWGVGEFPNNDKAEFITLAFSDMKTKYKRVRAAVYWHERWENKDGSYSNLHVNSSPKALDAYQSGVADPYWIGIPQFRKRSSK